VSEGITGRTPEQCASKFRKHIQELVSAIVPTKSHVRHTRHALDKQHYTLSFANPPANDAAAIQTAHGRVYLHIGQDVYATPVEQGFRLRTLKYRYALYDHRPTLESEPLFRWEYETKHRQPHSGEPRHHMQLGRGSRAQYIALGGSQLDLNRVHLPTGWVLIEEVLRFLVHDLGMKPPCGESWPEVLHESERAFFERFTTR